jgi:hypothetical protein
MRVFTSEENHLSGRALRQLMPFTSTYLSENGLSNYWPTKTKYIKRPNTAPDLRIQLSSIKKKKKKIIVKKESKATLRTEVYKYVAY